MPLDPTFVPALEKELEYAHQLKSGGQVTNPGRIAAIEAEIAAHSAAAPLEEEPTDESNKSTDYQSHDADADAKDTPEEVAASVQTGPPAKTKAERKAEERAMQEAKDAEVKAEADRVEAARAADEAAKETADATESRSESSQEVA